MQTFKKFGRSRSPAPRRNSLGLCPLAVNTPVVPPLLETLAAELERPRELTAQVVNHLAGTYGLTHEAIGTFLAAELVKLEDYEIDLILAPLFTPTLQDQAVFAELLGRDSIPTSHWPELIQQLVTRPTRAQFVTSDVQTYAVPLRDVTIERYVRRLRLDGVIPRAVFNLVNHLEPAADRPLLKAVARRAVWEDEARGCILVRYLSNTAGGGGYRLDEVRELLKLVETYQPADIEDLLAQIPHWQQVLRQEINEAASPKPFFNERVQELHGGGRDQRRLDNSRIAVKENEAALLARLQQALSS
jgi:hypothetical protein